MKVEHALALAIALAIGGFFGYQSGFKAGEDRQSNIEFSTWVRKSVEAEQAKRNANAYREIYLDSIMEGR